MKKALPIITLIMFLLLPTVAQASLASDMAAFKAAHSDIYRRIDTGMAAKMDQLVQDVYNDTMANYKSTESTYDQVNKYATRRLLRDPNYDSLLTYLAEQIDDPKNADVKSRYENLLDEICTIIAKAVDTAQNVKPGTGGTGGGGGTGSKIPIAAPAGTPPQFPPETPVAIMPTPAQLEEIQPHWANSQLQSLIALGIISGDEQGRINPDAQVTRAEFSAMLVRALRLENSPIIQGRFHDVPADSWCFNPVNIIADAGIVEGYQANLFGPHDPISREQMTVMIIRALQQQGKLPLPEQEHASILAPFIDRQAISSWATAAVSKSVELGLMEGRGNEAFAPQAHASRAEAGVIILRLLEKMSP